MVMSRFKRAKKSEPDEVSLNSEAVALPLPDNLDYLESVELWPTAPEWESVGSPSVAETADAFDASAPELPASSCSRPGPDMASEKVGVLGTSDMLTLRSMIEDGCLRAQPAFKFVMPWDRPGMSTVFNQRKKLEMPKPIMQLLEPSVTSASDQPTVLLPSEPVRRG